MQVRKGFLINISAFFHFQGQSFKMMTLISHFLLFPITIFSSYPWLSITNICPFSNKKRSMLLMVIALHDHYYLHKVNFQINR